MSDCSFAAELEGWGGAPHGAACRLWGRDLLIIALFGACILFPGLGSGRVLTRHELWFAQPAREMVSSGDWIVPRINGVPCTFYPPATQWSIASLVALSGRSDEWLVRIPSVLAGIVAAWIVGALMARWFGRRAGLMAGLMQLTMFYVLMQARLAESDMLLAATVCAAMYCFAAANIPGPYGYASSGWWPRLFYLAAGAAFLVKALMGIGFIFAACLAFLLLQRSWRTVRFLADPWGLLIFAVCVLAWPLAAYLRYPPFLDMQLSQHFGRMRGELGIKEPPLFYLYAVPMMVLPWTPLVIWGCVQALSRRLYREPFWQLLGCWVVPGLVVLSTCPFKSKHYLISLLPPLTVLGVAGWLDVLARRPQHNARVYLFQGAAILIGIPAGIVAVELAGVKGSHGMAMVVGVAGMGMLVVNWFGWRRRLGAEVAALFATVGLAAVMALHLIMPHYDSYRDRFELAGRLNAMIPAQTPIHLVDMPEDQIVYYLKRPVVRTDEPEDFPSQVRGGAEVMYVLGPQRLRDDLAEIGSVEVLDSCVSLRRREEEADRLSLFRVSGANGLHAQAARAIPGSEPTRR